MKLDQRDLVDTLSSGTIELKGEFLWGSNYTFLVEIIQAEKCISAVYKPIRGERPLWDFPTASLAKREVAAFIVSEALGWKLVPPTVYRKKGPAGGGSIQLFIEHDPNYHYFNFTSEEIQRLRPVVVFDLVVNNADRKGSHVLKDSEGHLWLIDHGLCFHVEEKLRTVIWDFVDEPIPENLLSDLTNFQHSFNVSQQDNNPLVKEILTYISLAELRAMTRRIDHLIAHPKFPAPDPYRRPFPWPQI